MSPLQAALWKILRERFYGVENASPRAAVLARYNLLHKAELRDRVFRDTVGVLVSVFKKPICTSAAKSYYVARTRSEKQQALNYLDSVLREVGERRRGLDEAETEEAQESLL